MAGTKEGFRKARIKLVKRLGSEEAYIEWRKQIGSKGGKNGRGESYQGGFAHPNADPRSAGAKGGKISKRTKEDS